MISISQFSALPYTNHLHRLTLYLAHRFPLSGLQPRPRERLCVTRSMNRHFFQYRTFIHLLPALLATKHVVSAVPTERYRDIYITRYVDPWMGTSSHIVRKRQWRNGRLIMAWREEWQHSCEGRVRSHSGRVHESLPSRLHPDRPRHLRT